MGGRGASSGIKRPQYFGETEKAVKLKLVVDDYDLETKKERIVYIFFSFCLFFLFISS